MANRHSLGSNLWVRSRSPWVVLIAIWMGCTSLATPVVAETTLAEFSATEHLTLEQRLVALEAELQELREGSEAGPASVAAGACETGWYVSADYLLWQVDRSDLGYAIRDPAGLGVPSAGQPVLSLDLGPESGFRVEVGQHSVGGWDFGFRYTHLDSSDRATFAPGGATVLAVQSSPATGLTNADSVTASSQFRLRVFDLEATYWYRPLDAVSVGTMLGARVAVIDHRLQAAYNGGAFVNGLVDVPTDADLFAGRLGGMLNCHVSSRFTVFGNAAASLGVAEIDARRRETNAAAVVLDARRTEDQIVPILEVSLGARYEGDRWSLSAGYDWSAWMNLVSPLEFADDFNGGTLTSAQRDLGIHGLFVNTTWMF